MYQRRSYKRKLLRLITFCVNLKHTALQRAVVVTNRLVVKINKAAVRKEPTWRRRLQNKIKELRKDLSQLESSKDKEVSNVRHWQTLERKYSIRVKTLGVVIEELQQRILAIAAKVRRYQERIDGFR